MRGFNLGKGTVVRFRGKDRCRVFNNLCTQDLRQLSEGQAVETFVTDVKGRTFGHGIALAINEEAWLVTVPNQASKLIPHFDRYIIREDAEIGDASDEYTFWLFKDPASAATGLGLTSDTLPADRQHQLVPFEGNQVVLIRTPWIGIDSLLAIVPNSCSDEMVKKQLQGEWMHSSMTDRTAWELARIQAFWPWYGVDMDERNLPQEVDRNESAISFNKGCYLGQETIARLDMLGQVQKKLVQLVVDSDQPIAAQTPVMALDGKEVGTVTSAATDPSAGKSIVLAYVKRSHFKPGQEVLVNNTKAVVDELVLST